MYKQHLSAIDGVAVWPIISLIIFFLFFVAMGIWAFTANKRHIQKMKELPLDDRSLEEITQEEHKDTTAP